MNCLQEVSQFMHEDISLNLVKNRGMEQIKVNTCAKFVVIIYKLFELN